ncbi:hypothetical protein B0H11DRAFT_1899459 [Mycena galericulata]|nr:hypothetical protein B0H11DRAFT_1899459 [Mycena galericulata]
MVSAAPRSQHVLDLLASANKSAELVKNNSRLNKEGRMQRKKSDGIAAALKMARVGGVNAHYRKGKRGIFTEDSREMNVNVDTVIHTVAKGFGITVQDYISAWHVGRVRVVEEGGIASDIQIAGEIRDSATALPGDGINIRHNDCEARHATFRDPVTGEPRKCGHSCCPIALSGMSKSYFHGYGVWARKYTIYHDNNRHTAVITVLEYILQRAH